MSTQNRWIKAVRCSDVPPREGRSVQIGTREIAVFNLGDRFVAIDNRCPHKGGPLAEGIVAGSSVVCPLHAWKVNLETGAIARPAVENSCVAAYAVRVVDEIVQLKLSLHSPAESANTTSCMEENSPAAWSFGAGTMGEVAP
jgi:nitrite reductase (NADH) small subunit